MIFEEELNWSRLAGATVGGMTTGAAIALTGVGWLNVSGASAIGGMTNNMTSQGIDIVDKVSRGENIVGLDGEALFKKVAFDAVFGPAVAKLPFNMPII